MQSPGGTEDVLRKGTQVTRRGSRAQWRPLQGLPAAPALPASTSTTRCRVPESNPGVHRALNQDPAPRGFLSPPTPKTPNNATKTAPKKISFYIYFSAMKEHKQKKTRTEKCRAAFNRFWKFTFIPTSSWKSSSWT